VLAYEAGEFAPPAPVARAVVRGPAAEVQPDVPLLIDTGADVSVVPRSVVEAVGAPVRPADVPLRFLDGREVAGDVAELVVEFLRYRFEGAFVVADAPYGVLGRNILNLLVVRLDGPRQTWST